jgi:alpha-glucosidase
MQWDAGPNAGFGPPGADTWLPVGPEHRSVNVESELEDPMSALNLYRRLLSLRKSHSALRVGSFLSHPASTEDVFAYRRESDSETMTVVLNFSDEERMIDVGRGEIVFSTTDPERQGRCRDAIALVPREGIVIDHT